MQEKILISGLNWLGDSIMSMPAVQMFKESHLDASITLLIKPGQTALWDMHPAIDEVIEYHTGIKEMWAIARILKERKFDIAYVFPNSFRSALIPYLAGIPSRLGFSGHYRSGMLTGIVTQPPGREKLHQSWEYVDIMGLWDQAKERLPTPDLVIPEQISLRMASLLVGTDDWIGLMPGAARGPSKRWPSEYFVETARRLAEETNSRICVLGSPDESDLCSQIAGEIGSAAISVAGDATIQESAALLQMMKAVVTNDSGGMHLAAAAGARVVAVFGVTDPVKTGPTGGIYRIVTSEGADHARDIKANSKSAIAALTSIKPDKVVSTVLEMLEIQESHRRQGYGGQAGISN